VKEKAIRPSGRAAALEKNIPGKDRRRIRISAAPNQAGRRTAGKGMGFRKRKLEGPAKATVKAVSAGGWKEDTLASGGIRLIIL